MAGMQAACERGLAACTLRNHLHWSIWMPVIDQIMLKRHTSMPERNSNGCTSAVCRDRRMRPHKLGIPV